jgi:ATP-dependent DNA ligase
MVYALQSWHSMSPRPERRIPTLADDGFPALDLPIEPPLAPMEAHSAERLPAGEGWLYEPKWDGFRCLLFRHGDRIALQSKSGQPLTRYFPELVAAGVGAPGAAGGLAESRLILDGEIVVGDARAGQLDFDALLQRIHPAASRIRKLAGETPATFVAFDVLLAGRGKPLLDEPLARRRERLERLAARWPSDGRFLLSPATRHRDDAEAWLRTAGAGGIDGVVAKRLEAAYLSGDRAAMTKVKTVRTADCVVGGFRWARGGKASGEASSEGKGTGGEGSGREGARGEGAGAVGSLLLGLYDDAGLLDHVGFCSSFTAAERRELAGLLAPHVESPGFTGKAPGGPSRWSRGRSSEWVPLRPELVCEVRYDQISGRRFRHGTQLLRWRPDKTPAACTFGQLELAPRPAAKD